VAGTFRRKWLAPSAWLLFPLADGEPVLYRQRMAASCYILEVSVEPGGARRGTAFVYNSLAHIRKCLEQEFLAEHPDERAGVASLAVCYGETIALWVVEEGRVVSVVDLRPFISVRVRDEPACPLMEAVHRDNAWQDQLSDGNVFRFELDWDSVVRATPPLRGSKLGPGESLELQEVDPSLVVFPSYIGITGEVNYGYNDVEGGEDAPPYFIDPDPPH